MPVRVDDFDLRMRPHEPVDAVENVVHMVGIFGDRCEGQCRPLPEILVIDLGGRHAVPASRGVEKVPDDGPLLLQRPALSDVDLDCEQTCVHGPGSGLVTLFTDVSGGTRHEPVEVLDLSLHDVGEPPGRVDLTRTGTHAAHHGIDELRHR